MVRFLQVMKCILRITTSQHYTLQRIVHRYAYAAIATFILTIFMHHVHYIYIYVRMYVTTCIHTHHLNDTYVHIFFEICVINKH